MKTIILLLILIGCWQCHAANGQSTYQARGTLHLVDSANRDSAWNGFTASGNSMFLFGGKEHEIAPDRIVAWQTDDISNDPRTEAVVLVDGSVFTGLIATLRDDSIRLQTSLFGLVSFPKSQVAAVVTDTNAASFAETYPKWIRDSTQGDDTISLRDGQIVSGVIKTLGTSTLLRLDNTQSIEIESHSQLTQISVSRVAAIRFSPILFPIDISSTGLVCDFADGTHLVVKTGQLKEDRFEIVTAAGISIATADLRACINQCIGISANASAQNHWKYVSQSDVLETRGQSLWTRNRWLYFESDAAHPSLFSAEQTRIRAVPSVRVKWRNQTGWKRIVGAFQIVPLAESETLFSDVLGARSQVDTKRKLDRPVLTVRFIAVADGKLVDLWTVPTPERSYQSVPFSIDIANYSAFYLLVENSNIFSTPTEIVFDRMRFSQ